MITRNLLFGILTSVSLLLSNVAADEQTPDSIAAPTVTGVPVVLDDDTLFSLSAHLGPFSPQQRVAAVHAKLSAVVKNTEELRDSIHVVESMSSSNLIMGNIVLMAVTDDDANPLGKTRQVLAGEYAELLNTAIRATHERYSLKSLTTNAAITVGLLLALIAALWAMRKIFTSVYARLESWEGTRFRPISFRSNVILSAETITSFFILLAKGIRLALSFGIIYLFLTYVLSLFPWTRGWNVKPILGGLFSIILVTAAAYVTVKGANAFFRMMERRVPTWKGTLIRPIRLKTMEVLSADRIVEITEFGVKAFHFAVIVALLYIYVTFVFSFFEFTQTWASTLFSYVTDPLWGAFVALVKYLPNLFYIVTISFLTRFVIKFVQLVFSEVERGTISLPGFYAEWAEPTYKIVRFLILAFAAIVIFPYLPGSDSPFFQGISVFLGILFSLGSSSAIANMVAGVVITYMRPFRIGDRVKIADTMGDVIEKTLLVTRVRTIKNVDITIPNAMVLGSHIINFSSSAQDKGLILHTTVTIGYDVPWKQVHALLMSAADATTHILKDPKPFVLQTSLDDFYVSYELNAFTDTPGIMARIYSELHQNIQDKFNEGGVEILSPHYAAMRDGNQVTIPQDYLPKTYQAPAFRIFPMGGFFDKSSKSE